ncbi:hypothetical protein U1Q18_025653 [Sarracenia purpurea var. burkii]
MSIRGNLKEMFRSKSMDEELSKVLRSERKSLGSEIIRLRDSPKPFLSERMAAIEARIQRIKRLSLLRLGLKSVGDESGLADDRDLVEEGNPRSVTPLAVGDHFGSESSDAIRDKKEKPKSSCESEQSNGVGVSVGKKVCAPEPVVDGKGGKLDSDMVAQTSREEGVDLDTIREAPLVAQGHSTGTETGKIEDEPFLDAPIFGDEVIKLVGTHVDFEKREHEVASEGDDEGENGSTSEMGGGKCRRSGDFAAPNFSCAMPFGLCAKASS